MIEPVYHAYVMTLPWVMMLGLASSLWRRDWALLRCVAIVALGQLALDAWFAFMVPEKFVHQPYAAYFAIYGASSIASSVRPSGKLCSTMGGVFIAGTAFSIIALAMKVTPGRDYAFWQVNVLIGVMTLAVILGGATGERGRRFCVAAWRGVARLVDRSRKGRVA